MALTFLAITNDPFTAHCNKHFKLQVLSFHNVVNINALVYLNSINKKNIKFTFSKYHNIKIYVLQSILHIVVTIYILYFNRPILKSRHYHCCSFVSGDSGVK